MTRSMKIFCAIVCSFAMLFIGVGYAALSGTLTITGTATYTIPELYISEATSTDGKGSGITHSETMFSATSDLSGGSAVYQITMVNTTMFDYGYLMTIAISDDVLGADNDLVNYEVYMDQACTDVMERRTILPPTYTEVEGVTQVNPMVFYLKITPKEATTQTATVYLNFRFITPVSDIPSPDESIGALAGHQALESFAGILNNTEKLAELKGQMENATAARDNGRDTFFISFLSFLFPGLSCQDTIAYVPGTISKNEKLNPSDAEVCLELFGGENLTLIIDGEPQQVYFMIYMTDVDGITGEEYVLYMTTDPLTDETTTSRGSYTNRETAEVFAGVFTSYTDTDGVLRWYQLGDMLTGEATICDYSGGSFSDIWNGVVSGSGSFNAQDWVTKNAYYGVDSGATVQTVMQAKANKDSPCMAGLKAQLDIAYSVLTREEVLGGQTLYAEDIYTEETLNNLKAIYGWDEDGTQVNGLSDTYDAIMNGTATNYTQAMVVTCTRWLNEALVNLKVK